MAVRTHLPWWGRSALLGALLLVIAGMWWWGFDFGQIFGGFHRKQVEERYAKEPFVDVLPPGSHPDTRSVRAANVCRLALHRPPERSAGSDTLVVLSVIDNLVKGAAGQAVQNMNLMFGLPETTGLQQPPVVP
jgi:N-acetyl-gamma-glutamylphosphate reductase